MYFMCTFVKFLLTSCQTGSVSNYIPKMCSHAVDCPIDHKSFKSVQPQHPIKFVTSSWQLSVCQCKKDCKSHFPVCAIVCAH